MTKETNAAAPAKEPKAPKEPVKMTLKADKTKYVSGKSASGKKTLSCGDAVAQALEGLSLEAVYDVGAKVTGSTVDELKTKYSKLNPGQQRMNVGNRVRGAVVRMNKEKEGSGDKAVTSAAKPHQDERKAAQKAADAAKKEAEKTKAEKVKAEKTPKAAA